jgi:hypothetical protein
MTIEIIKEQDNAVAAFFSATTQTPETDACWDKYLQYPYSDIGTGDIRILAQRLERERDKAMKLFESGRRACASLNEALDKTLHELREAREDVMKLQDIKRKHEHEELASAQENDRLKQERDEAREATPCPHCETESYSQDERDYWKCGTIRYEEKCVVRTDLCNEREERKAAESKLAEAREQNTALRDIAEWFANQFFENDGDERWPSCPVTKKAQSLRAELDQLKEGAK